MMRKRARTNKGLGRLHASYLKSAECRVYFGPRAKALGRVITNHEVSSSME